VNAETIWKKAFGGLRTGSESSNELYFSTFKRGALENIVVFQTFLPKTCSENADFDVISSSAAKMNDSDVYQ
jgi:hypothetical protein